MPPNPTRYAFEPIGFVRSPFHERAAAPRQPGVGARVSGTIELLPGFGYEHALDGLAGWERIWILFVFHQNVEQARGWKPHVLPPRSAHKQGVFSTRSPHRPNPIGMSAVGLESVDGLRIHVKDIDLLDGTPVIDIKPYVPYSDAYPGARSGWLEAADPVQPWDVAFEPRASEQLGWLRERGVDLEPPIRRVLSLGPQPHPYRRIRESKAGLTLAVKDWRVDFRVEGRRVLVGALRTGYRRAQLAQSGLELPRSFFERWSDPIV